MATRSLVVRPLTSKEHETYKHLVKVIPDTPVNGHSPSEVLRYLIQKSGGNRAHIEEQINAWFDGKLTLKEEAWTTFSSKKPEPSRRHFAGQRGERQERGDKDRQRPAKGAASKGKDAEKPKRHGKADSDEQKSAEGTDASGPSTPEQPKRETWASRLRKVLETEVATVTTVGEEEVPEESVVEATAVEPEVQPEEKVEQEAGEPVVSDPRVVRGVWGNKAGLSNVKSSKPVVKPQPAETEEDVAEAEVEEKAVEEAQQNVVAEPEAEKEPEVEPKEEEKAEVVEPAVVEPVATTKRGIHFGRSVKEQSKGKFKFGATATATGDNTKSKHMTGSELDKYVLDSIQNNATEEAPAAKPSKPKRENRYKEKKEPVAPAPAPEAAAPAASEEAPKETEKVESTPVVPTPPPVPPTNAFPPNMYAQFPAWMNNPMLLSLMYQMMSNNQMMQPGMTAGGTFPSVPTMSSDFQPFMQNSQVTSDGPGTSTHGMGDFSGNPGFNNMASNFGQAGFNTLPGHVSSMPYNNFGQTEAGSNKGNFSQGAQQQNRQWNTSQNTFSSGNTPYSFNSNVAGQAQHSGQPGQFAAGNYGGHMQFGYDKNFFDKNNQGPNAQAPGLKQNNASQGTYSYPSVSSYNAGGASQSPNFNNAQSETAGHLNSVPFNYPSSYSSSGQNYYRPN